MSLVWLAAAVAAFLGSHFLMSHPLRAPLVKSMGTKGFLGFYSLVAIVTLLWAVIAFDRAPEAPALWNGHAAVPWVLASVLTIAALALFLGSLHGNPAMPGARVAGLSAIMPKGVFQVTRHPMMMGFALWAVSHLLIAPTPRSFLFVGGILILALGGARLQDRKKDLLHGRDWRAWMKRTTFWPRLSKLDKLGWNWSAGFMLWLLITWLHMPIAHEPAGLWMLLRPAG